MRDEKAEAATPGVRERLARALIIGGLVAFLMSILGMWYVSRLRRRY